MGKSDGENSLEDYMTGAFMLSFPVLQKLRERELVEDGKPWMIASEPEAAQFVYCVRWEAENVLYTPAVMVW